MAQVNVTRSLVTQIKQIDEDHEYGDPYVGVAIDVDMTRYSYFSCCQLARERIDPNIYTEHFRERKVGGKLRMYYESVGGPRKDLGGYQAGYMKNGVFVPDKDLWVREI